MKVIVVICFGALASCATGPENSQTRIQASHPADSSLSGQVLKEVNDYRRSQGALDLQRHAGLDRLAQQHCEYMRKNRGTFKIHGENVSHMGFEGRALVARERFEMQNISENAAAASNPGKNPAQVLVNQWSQSKGHRFNMLGNSTHTGIGVVVDSDGMVFSTELFASVNNSQLANHRRFSGF